MAKDIQKSKGAKPRIAIIGFPRIIAICRKVARVFKKEADFEFITSALDEAILLIKKKDLTGIDILIAGPGNSDLLKKRINLPVIPFFTSTRALIRAIQVAKSHAREIALVVSVLEKYDLSLFENLLDVRLKPFYSNNIHEYRTNCMKAKEEGFKVVIGGSYVVEVAESFGIEAVFSYDEEDIFHEAIQKAIEICNYNTFLMKKTSQLDILLRNSNDPLFIIDENKKITWLNNAAEKKFEISSEHALDQAFKSVFAELPDERMNEKDPFEFITLRGKENVILDFHPVLVKNKTHGMVVAGRLARDIEETDRKIRKYIQKKGFEAKFSFRHLIGKSAGLTHCIQKAKKYATADSPILIYGKTGTGKEMFAQAIHNYGARRNYPFVAINCASLPRELIESELFGYEKGAFTGAHKQGKAGLIELSHRGTLFLDEISSLEYSLQAKLLRLVQEKEFIRIGGNKVIPVDIRIISATNEDLWKAIREGKFREDLYYRLSTLYIQVPPLHERKEDIPLLFLHFLEQINPSLAKFGQEKGDSLYEELMKLSLPGNIRELQNIAKRFSLMLEPGWQRSTTNLKQSLLQCCEKENFQPPASETNANQVTVPIRQNLKSTLKEAEKAIIQKVLEHNDLSMKDFAASIGIQRATLWRKLKEYNIQSKRWGG